MAEKRKLVERRTWKVSRYGWIDEVTVEDGSIRYHVQVQDEARPPFLTRWFNEIDRAESFLDKVQSNAAEVFEH